MEDPATPVPLERLLAHRAWVRQVARALVVDESRAEDLEQEAWLEAIRRPPADARSLRGWLGTVVRHKAADAGRSDARRGGREQAAARPEATRGAADLVAEAEVHQKVVRAVLDLEEPYRSTLLLRYFEDRGPADIAARDGVPLETVRTRLRRGREALRERFDRESGGNRGAWLQSLTPLVLGAEAATGGAAAVPLLATKARVALAAAVVLAAAGWAFWGSGPPREEERPRGGSVVASVPGASPVLRASPAPAVVQVPAPEPGGSPALPPEDPAPVLQGAAAAPVPDPVVAPGPSVAPAPPVAPAPVAAPAPVPPPPPAPPVRAEEPAGKAVLEVIVIDRRGRPIPGAAVKIHGPGRSMPNLDMAAFDMDPPAPRPAIREGVGDDRGRFVADRLLPGAYWARATRDGSATSTTIVRLSGESSKATVRLLLEPEAILQGVVRRVDGSPAAGVRVVARRFTELSLIAFDRISVVAGPDGAYRIAGLAPGVHDILLGPTPDLLLSAGAVEVPQVATFDPALPPAATVRGKVVDDVTGTAVAGATVRLSGYDAVLKRQHAARTQTGPDGTWRIEGFPGGSDAWLYVRKEGYLPSFDGGSDPKAHIQGIVAGGEFLRDVRLARGGRVKGRVKDPDGKPIAGAFVQVEIYTEHGMQRSPVGVSGEDGVYSIEPVLPGDSVLLAGAAGYTQRDVGEASAWDLISDKRVPASVSLSVRTGEVAEKDVVLEPVPAGGAEPPPPAAVLAGTVKRADGSAPVNLRLRLLRNLESGGQYWSLRNAQVVAAREDGTFRLEGLPAGSVALAAQADGCAVAVGPWVPLENGKVRDGYSLTLVPGFSISGMVVDEAGKPVRGAGITAGDGVEIHFLAGSDARGRFTVTGLAAGEWPLTAQVPGASLAFATASTGATDVVLTVRGGAFLRGTVVDAETGAPIPDITVEREWRGTGEPATAHTGRDGSFTLPASPGGHEEITAGLANGNDRAESDYVPEIREFDAPPAGEVRFALRKGLAIAGRVLAVDGSPIRRRFQIEVDGEADPGWPYFSRTWFLDGEPDGTFRVRGLPPGNFNLTFEDDADPAFTPLVATGVRSGTLDLAVRQEPALPIEGRVVDEEGHAPGVPGWVQPIVRGHEERGPPLPVAKIGPDGAFRTSPIHAKDTVDLCASHFEGFLTARLEKVEPGATGVVIRIRRGAVLAGRVVDLAGNPVGAGVPVTAFLPLKEGATRSDTAGDTKTGEDGTFTLRGLPGDAYLLEAGGLGCDFLAEEPKAAAKAGEKDLVLRVHRGLTVELVVIGGGDMDMFCVSQAGRSEMLHAEEGKVVVRGLEPGKFRITDFTGETAYGEFDAAAGKGELRLR